MKSKLLGVKRYGMDNKGFTLIEIAVVLVIIGLIIGAAVKGKDLIQSAKQKKFYTSFVKAWELAVVSYYDRTGFALGDGTANGGTQATPNGRFDNVNGSTFGNTNGIDAKLKSIGLTVPSSNTANSGQITYKGQNATGIITLYLQNARSFTDGTFNNAFVMNGMPTDLAIALDAMVDGQQDARAGKFRRNPDNAAPNDGSWPNVTTTATVSVQYILDVP